MRQILFLAIFLFSLTLTAQEKMIGNSVTKDLIDQMEKVSESELIRINIRLTDQYDVRNLEEAFPVLDRAGRRALVTSELKSFSQRTQKRILDLIDEYSRLNQAELIHSLWINNVITSMASKELIFELSQRGDIDRIDWDEERYLLMEQDSFMAGGEDSPEGTLEITYNVSIMNVPAVWGLGFQGQGVVVAVLDTGVNYNHADLAGHMWTHPSYPNHGWNFVENDNNPMDYHSHGTHCAGTVASDGTAGSQAGMAPLAEIMALKILNNSGGGVESNVWAGIQFAVVNGADVLSLSIGWLQSSNPDRQSWRNSFNNALAAGVISAVAAGNEGTTIGAPNNLRTPGDIPPPWLHPDQTTTGGLSGVVSVGATNSSDGIASFSSRGPVTWQTVNPFNDYPYNPGMGILRPDVTAPGVDVKSCSNTNNTGYTFKSGTSMATPGVAGVMALLLSKNPNLTPAQILEALEMTSVDLGTAGKDNTYGAGRVNALAAINYVNYPGPVYSSHSIADPNSNGQIEAGESIQLSIEMYNGSDTPRTNVSVTINTNSPYITITDNSEFYGNFAAWQYKTVTNGFAFSVAANTPGMETIRFNISATDGIDTWTSFFDVVSYGPRLEFGAITINDLSGNNNGRLDPGETVDLLIAANNSGQLPINNVLVTVSSLSNLIILNNTQFTVPVIPATGSANAVFNLTVDNNAPVGGVVDFHFEMVSGAFGDIKDAVLSIGLIVEDWETGNFASYPWTFGGNVPWTITNVNPYEGDYSAKSGTITHNQTSVLEVELNVSSTGTISFFRKVSSEASWDFLRFYIDGSLQGEWSGEVSWSEVSYPVSVGIHTFRWLYYKDGSVSSGSDCAWVDFIVFPPLVPLPTPPDILLSPGQYDEVLPIAGYKEKMLNIANTGEAELTYSAQVVYNPGEKSIATIYPTNAPFHTGTTTTSTKTQSSLVKGAPPAEAGWMRFDLSTIPDGSTINSVEFHGYVNATYYPYWNITPVTVDPLTASPSDLYNDIVAESSSGHYLFRSESSSYAPGWKVHMLGGTANADLEASLMQDWFTIGIMDRDASTYYIHFDGWNQANKPYLVVDYTYNPTQQWLKINGGLQIAGTVNGNSNQDITVSFDAGLLEVGTYTAAIQVTSNDPNQSFAQIFCTLEIAEEMNLDLTAMLEGGMQGSGMSTYLNSAGLLPLAQPFHTAPWNYPGTESVASIPNADVVDWVLIELRETTGDASAATPATMITRQAGFILNNGTIVDIDGFSMLRFDLAVNNNLFVIAHHRNHLGIMSANPVLQTGGNYIHNFTTGPGQAHGGINAQKQIASGVWGMISGDINADGVINMADKSPEWEVQAGEAGYHQADLNFDGQVNNIDKDDFLVPNLGKSSMIPN